MKNKNKSKDDWIPTEGNSLFMGDMKYYDGEWVYPISQEEYLKEEKTNGVLTLLLIFAIIVVGMML